MVGQGSTDIVSMFNSTSRNVTASDSQPKIYLANNGNRRVIIEFPTQQAAFSSDIYCQAVTANGSGQSQSNTVGHDLPEGSPSRSLKGSITLIKRNSLQNHQTLAPLNAELSLYARESLETMGLPAVDTLAAPKLCSVRLRHVIDLLQSEAPVSREDLIKNLSYSVSVLDSLYIEETRRLLEDDDVLNEVGPDAVPSEVREWLAQTFTKSSSVAKVRGERPKFKSVANAIRAGIMVDKIYRRGASNTFIENHLQPPAPVAEALKNINQWGFDIWELNELSENHSLRYMGYELLQKQGLISKLKMSPQRLDNFLTALEKGYSKHGNPYHNLIHGADVTQTCYYLLRKSGLMKWLTDIEIFATFIAALIHDYEHTGTTNNYHIMTDSHLAQLYNDRSVLENHHISAAFELMKSEDMNIISGLKKDEYREFRSLVIDMVLATDMSSHFTQLKTMKSLLACPENIEKSKALCLVLHAADISHPSKPWNIHKPWTDRLIEEFFKQGDQEKQLGLQCSPLCDRQSTLVEESQIGFIDIIVKPTMNVLGDMLEKVVKVLNHSDNKKTTQGAGIHGQITSTVMSNQKNNSTSFERAWNEHLPINRKKWSQLAGNTDDDIANNNDTEKEKEETTIKAGCQGISRSTSTTGLSQSMMSTSSCLAARSVSGSTSTAELSMEDGRNQRRSSNFSSVREETS